MDAREIKVINTSGRNGQPGTEYWNEKAAEAPLGQRGQDGGSAGAPTAGQPASDIRVRLAYSPEEKGVVQVTGEGSHSGQPWKIARDEKLRLNAKGGDGGAGGRGEDGQAGGRGKDGRNATRHRNGEDGGNGARGGDGGYGSNGADGAAGGNVFVTINEDDTDLLIGLEYDVQGGAGGLSGQHGEPGDGGIGGRGGSPHAWTERHGNRVSAHTRPGGNNGTNGSPGARPTTYLSGGKAGPQGSIQIKVIRGDLSEATYPSPYSLQVVKFDVIDENADGINEPGEHLLVHNIRVRNAGGMPSPGSRSIHLLIQGTQYLEPITSEPVELPRSIQPGQEVEVPGVLRAFIRNEWSEKPLGQALNHFDNVQLLATFHERLNRPVPNFCGLTQILIRYPLRLEKPTYLDCVGKGDRVRFKWVVHNDSTKSYGIEGLLKRVTSTKLSDPGRLFKLTNASVKPDEASDELPEIEPNSMIIIDQDFSVDERTLEFSEGSLTLELMLSDPITGKLRSVQKHQMNLMISGSYSLSPNPSYLLVVNSKTPNHAIHQIITLVRHRLHTYLDIFNLSLTGTYESPVTKENVLKSYLGKSVIIFGNSFPYFEQGDKDPWSLLDPWHTGLLLKGGTNLLFTGVSNMIGLKEWAGNATFPVHDFTAGAPSHNDGDFSRVVTEIRKTEAKPLTSDVLIHRMTVKKGIFGSVQSKVDSAANSAAEKLNKNLPLRRFITVPDLEVSKEANKNSGGMFVCEGVPKNAKMVASVGFFPPSTTNMITDYDMFFIVSCLPFAVKARMFWNMIGKSDASGVGCDTIYLGIDSICSDIPDGTSKVDDKILQALSLSLQFDITAELYNFTSSLPRFPDPLSVPDKLAQLHLFSQFFASAPKSAQITDIGKAQLLVSTLGTIHAIANPIGFWQSVKGAFAWVGNRKGQLTPAANAKILAAITASCSGDVAATVKSHMLQRSKQVKEGIKRGSGHKSFTNFGIGELTSFAGTKDVIVVDLTEVKAGSMALDGKALVGHQEGYRVQRQGTIKLEGVAKGVLRDIVNPVEE
ncbi:hypothetical protein BDZ45DRAFT_804902 [Acephala macrosclerotiorum]|nr:hypothetical protein BDZ45DRAFT_804902 [Acephala macrosclerotiorum]